MTAVRRVLLLLAAALLLAAQQGGSLAVEPDEVLPDSRLEARARALSAELRCLVCQNQSIDDSNAPLARDLRLLVRERLKAGDSDEQVRQFIVGRYGSFVLLRPPFDATTLLLWLTPVLVLAATAAAIVVRRRTRPVRNERVELLSGEERRKLEQVLGRSGQQVPSDPPAA
jgi:cytochrome c-type biogenesis protein CcmH